ncbi:hypothetical protein [Paraliomyxa miuraensis]|uniref:hypothetical protein n=1 Tax=Paraliomyxa miuraensis TaxID=376150 RepID=UPI00225173F0|nr:hypothetical protein [Paraliomyxa miuraensis]MCX4247420.1 hypothetical protein [Paraliomyxa miuraensis]
MIPMALIPAVALAAACGDDNDATFITGTSSPTTSIPTIPSTTSSTAADETMTVLDVGNGSATEGMAEGGCNGDDITPPNAMLQGTVYAPNLEIPISGALVYVADQAADPVPDEVYCAECVELTCDANYTLTEADGSFQLPAVAGVGKHLVVQKGQFLRDVVIDVQEGSNVVPPDQSNLPGEWNPAAGMWIPRIAVYETDPDQVFNVLAKFGLGEVSASGTLIPGTERFDLVPDTDQGAFMDDLVAMSQYHIIFVPCAATKFWIGAPGVPAQRAQNIRDYVEAGGKWYATDHSNEYIEAPFPQYQEFYNPAMPDIQPAYDVSGTIADPELLAWLEALPPALKDIGGGNPNLYSLPSVELRLNYTGIETVHDVIVQDDEGNDVNVGHHTWVTGPCTSCTTDPATFRAMAVSGGWGCGRMMYSTFENSSMAHQGLNPQELVLLYMILEIGVCHDKPPPPVPPVG